MKNLSFLTFLIISHSLGLFTIVLSDFLEEQIHLRLYKNDATTYEQEPISQGVALLLEGKGYNQSLPLVLLIHGIETGADCKFVNGLLEAFKKRQLTNEYNIFALDMPRLFENSVRNEFYLGILASVQPAGYVVGEFLSNIIDLKLTDPGRINIIGYSMGAQVAGYAARIVKQRFGQINFIAGLDPAGPGFHTKWKGFQALVHVSAADARITHFYHTNSISCGTRDRVATADFVFNKGTVQPGCTKEAGLDCSHIRVPDLYIEAVTNPKHFVARKCSSWEEFKSCDCNNHETVDITFPPDDSARGIYYLRTRSKSPFALGRRGSQCSKILRMQHQKYSINALKKENLTYSKVSERVENLKNSLHRSYKLNDNISMHLMNGIRKLEDLQTPKLHEQLDNRKIGNETKESKDSLEDNSVEITSQTETAEILPAVEMIT